MTTPTQQHQVDPQFAVQVTYRDTGHVETTPTGTRGDAEQRAAHAHDPWPTGRVAKAVERTPSHWSVYAGVLPTLAEGASIEWGVRRTWRDGHVEYERRSSRALAAQAVDLAALRPDVGPTVVLVFRVLPAWAPIGGAS